MVATERILDLPGAFMEAAEAEGADQMPSKPLTEAEISTKLHLGNVFRVGDRAIRVLFLLLDSLWRPLKASWWSRKEASIIGGDEFGNYILRLSDGSVQLWDHSAHDTVLLAPSVRGFLDNFKAGDR